MDDYAYGKVILWSAVAAFLVGIAFALRNILWLSLPCLFVAMIAGLGALSEMIWYFMRGHTEQLRAQNEAKARTPEIIRMEVAAKLTQWQAALIESGRMEEDWAPMLEGPLKSYTLTFKDKSMMKVPCSFAEDFLEQAGDVYLAPTSQYNASAKRTWANSIVKWLYEHRMVIEEQGNLAASWQLDGRKNALAAFGLEEE